MGSMEHYGIMTMTHSRLESGINVIPNRVVNPKTHCKCDEIKPTVTSSLACTMAECYVCSWDWHV